MLNFENTSCHVTTFVEHLRIFLAHKGTTAMCKSARPRATLPPSFHCRAQSPRLAAEYIRKCSDRFRKFSPSVHDSARTWPFLFYLRKFLQRLTMAGALRTHVLWQCFSRACVNFAFRLSVCLGRHSCLMRKWTLGL